MEGGNVALSVLQRECGGGSMPRLQAAARQHYIDCQPALWREQEVTGTLAESVGPDVDKAFAVAWQDDYRLLVGTKSNHLLQWDTAAGSLRSVPLPPPPPRRQPVVESAWGSCGIHSVAVNAARDLVATGGAEPADCVVLRLPDFQPVQTLVGHQDWVFGAAWVSDRHVVTGSRDQSVALWTIPEPGQGAPLVQCKGADAPDGLLRKFEGKVRDVKYDFDSCRLAALSTDGHIKQLDPARGLRTVRTFKLSLTKELVCLEQRHDLLAVGSVGHVTLLDPRRRHPELRAVASPDEDQGVRSMQLTHHLLTFGSGRGKLFFYDLRAQAFLPTQPAQGEGGSEGPPHLKPARAAHRSPRLQPHLELGEGYVVKNDLYYDHFAGTDIRHACYAHTWDASCSRLFVCGGPLAFGLQGCYMSIWH